MAQQETPQPAPQANLQHRLMKIRELWNRLPAEAKYLIAGILGVLICVAILLSPFGPCLGCEYQKLPQAFQVPLLFVAIAGLIGAIIKRGVNPKMLFLTLLLLTLFIYLLWIAAYEGDHYVRPQCSPTPTVTPTPTLTPTLTPTPTITLSPTLTITRTPTPCPPVQVSYLEFDLDLAAGTVQITPPPAGVIILTRAQIGSSAALSGRVILGKAPAAGCYSDLKWEGTTRVGGPWKTITGNPNSSFSIMIPNHVTTIFLKLTIGGQQPKLYTIQIQPALTPSPTP
jgi:hypothetical protein